MKKLKHSLLMLSALAVTSTPVFAVPVTFFDTIPLGQAQFDATVTGTGATVANDTLSGLSYGNSWTRADYTITTTNGANKGVYAASVDNSTGQMIGINPANPAPNSGITFTFNSAINALGFEVGDWATCCFVSNLYISFDGGATQLVASAANYMDNPATAAGGNRGDSVFIGAIDDTSTFTTVTFYGDGFGEFLTAGGTIKYAKVDIGSVGVPEPATLALLGLGLAGIGFGRKKKTA